MANTKSAKKRIKQSERHRVRNHGQLATCRTAVKKLRSALEAGNKEEIQTLLPAATRILDRAADRNLIHKNAAARTKSRLKIAATKALAAEPKARKD